MTETLPTTTPGISTVTAPVEQAGRTLIDLLLDARDVGRAARIVLPAVLRVRDSTGPAAAGPRRNPRSFSFAPNPGRISSS